MDNPFDIPEFKMPFFYGMGIIHPPGIGTIKEVPVPLFGGAPFPYQSGLLELVANANLVDNQRVQFRFPRTKKRRIQNKWKKDPRNFKTVEVPADHCYWFKDQNKLVAHPETIEKLKKVINEYNQIKKGVEKHVESKLLRPSERL